MGYSDLDVFPGDELRLTVQSYDIATGDAIIENLSTGESRRKRYTSGSGPTLCQTAAGWFVRENTPLSDFGPLTFANAEIAGIPGKTWHDERMWTIEKDGKALTSVCTRPRNVGGLWLFSTYLVLLYYIFVQ